MDGAALDDDVSLFEMHLAVVQEQDDLAGIFHAITMAPYDIEGRAAAWWDEIKEAEAGRNLEYYRKFIPNLTDDNIIKRTTNSWM